VLLHHVLTRVLQAFEGGFAFFVAFSVGVSRHSDIFFLASSIGGLWQSSDLLTKGKVLVTILQTPVVTARIEIEGYWEMSNS
jgi:hypothetical protein